MVSCAVIARFCPSNIFLGSSHLFLTLLLSFLGKLRPQGQIWGQRNKASFNHWDQLQPYIYYTSFLVRGVDGASSAQRQAMHGAPAPQLAHHHATTNPGLGAWVCASSCSRSPVAICVLYIFTHSEKSGRAAGPVRTLQLS